MATIEEQPVSQVADGSLPDANGWYKSNIVIDNSAEENAENNEAEYPYMKSSRLELEKAAKDWPEGKLFRMSYGTAETIGDALSISYGHEQTDKGFVGTVQIDLYINVSEADKQYQQIADSLVEQDKENFPEAKWTEWPKGFPNKNDYENVSRCGANHDSSTVVWVQNKTLVKLNRLRLSEGILAMFPEDERAKVVAPDLKDYADGVWQAVHGMGL